MKKNILIGLLAIILLSTIVFGISAAETTTLRFASGSMGGNFYMIAAGIMQLVSEKDPTIKLDVVPGAGLERPVRVGLGDVEMAISQTANDTCAFKGIAPFTESYPDIRGGFKGLGFNVLQFIVTKDTGLNSIDDLIDQKYPIDLVVEPTGSTDPLFAQRILGFYGVDFNTIKEWGGSVNSMGYDDQIIYFKDRHANAAFQNISAPSPSIEEVAFSKIDLRLLKFSDELKKYLEENYACGEFVIPKGTYGFLEEDIINPGVEVGLIFNKNVPDDVVYRIIKIIVENAERVESLSPSLKNVFKLGPASIINLGVPLHPGAEKYYKEIGWIK